MSLLISRTNFFSNFLHAKKVTEIDLELFSFASDTCTALENFQEDPSNSTLGAILPCDELQSAESVLSDFGAGVYDIVNQVYILS